MEKGKTNHFRRDAHKIDSVINASALPKSNFYREELVPFIGACVTVVCDDFCVQNNYIDKKPCKWILLTNPRIVKVPSRMRNMQLPTTSHLWVAVDKDWTCNVENACLKLRGFLYEYEHKGHKNIGLKVVGTRLCLKGGSS